MSSGLLFEANLLYYSKGVVFMIYVTGDMHGDIHRFKTKALKKLKKNDTLIICGDFGFLWDGSEKERKLLDWIGKRRYHVLFVEGTHDNLDLLNSYPTAEWNGGLVHEISGNLKHLCRGQVFRLEDLLIFTFGGGESQDADLRRQTWWSAELPSEEELKTAQDNLVQHHHHIDYIITHQCSRNIKKFLTMEDNEINILDTFFDQIRESCTYKRWFFGNYHINKIIPPREYAVFDAVTPIQSEKIIVD